jgi:hypothetical protein
MNERMIAEDSAATCLLSNNAPYPTPTCATWAARPAILTLAAGERGHWMTTFTTPRGPSRMSGQKFKAVLNLYIKGIIHF